MGAGERSGDEIVRMIAHSFRRRVPRWVDFWDLYQAGMLGLLLAQRSYRPGRGGCFETYATHRVRGAVRDYLRKCDPLTREQRRALNRGEALRAPVAELDHYEPELPEMPQTLARVRAALGCLTPREQHVIRGEFYEEKLQKDIAAELSVCAARVIQLRRQALAKLRARL